MAPKTKAPKQEGMKTKQPKVPIEQAPQAQVQAQAQALAQAK